MLSPLVSMALNLMLSEEDSKRCRAEYLNGPAIIITEIRAGSINIMCFNFYIIPNNA